MCICFNAACSFYCAQYSSLTQIQYKRIQLLSYRQTKSAHSYFIAVTDIIPDITIKKCDILYSSQTVHRCSVLHCNSNLFTFDFKRCLHLQVFLMVGVQEAHYITVRKVTCGKQWLDKLIKRKGSPPDPTKD